MYYYIINPTAGGNRLKSMQDSLRERLGSLGIDGEFAKTTGLGDATKLARYAIDKGHTTIVAVGGDGTLNEVINGVTGRVAVGLVPIGHSNAVANQLGISSWEEACQILAERRVNELNLIAAGQNYFISTLTLGFETDLDKQVETSQVNRRNLADKLKRSWVHAQTFKNLTCTLKTEDFTMQAEVFSLSVVNQKFMTPQSTDRLDVSLLISPSGRKRTNYIWKTLNGTRVLEDNATTRFLADRLLIETDPPTGITVDGQLIGRTPIAIRRTDRKVRFIVAKSHQ